MYNTSICLLTVCTVHHLNFSLVELELCQLLVESHQLGLGLLQPVLQLLDVVLQTEKKNSQTHDTENFTVLRIRDVYPVSEFLFKYFNPKKLFSSPGSGS